MFLTRKRIESAVPLTANELQADKDKLRAQHAMALRKTEMALNKQRSKVTKQATEISDLEAQIKLLKAENALQNEVNLRLEKAAKAVAVDLTSRQEALEDVKLQLSTTGAELAVRSGELESLSHLYQELEHKLSENAERAKEGELQIARLTAAISDYKVKRAEDQAKVREIRVETKATEELLKNERLRSKELEKKYGQLLSQKSDLEDKLSRREKEMVRLREKRIDENATTFELEQRLADTEAERLALEKEVGDLTLQLNRISKSLGTAAPEKMAEALQIKSAKLELDLKALRQERDNLKKQVSSHSAPQALQALNTKPMTAKTVDSDALLRDQLKQLAAEVVHMTSIVEGDGSRVNDLLKNIPASTNGVISLAERIAALKKASKAPKAAE
ncbi:MAG: hypothetical protein U5K75_03990 [Ahrensia sp.]|nr:hypothetical protein [Ahrensia sp.]